MPIPQAIKDAFTDLCNGLVAILPETERPIVKKGDSQNRDATSFPFSALSDDEDIKAVQNLYALFNLILEDIVPTVEAKNPLTVLPYILSLASEDSSIFKRVATLYKDGITFNFIAGRASYYGASLLWNSIERAEAVLVAEAEDNVLVGLAAPKISKHFQEMKQGIEYSFSNYDGELDFSGDALIDQRYDLLRQLYNLTGRLNFIEFNSLSATHEEAEKTEAELDSIRQEFLNLTGKVDQLILTIEKLPTRKLLRMGRASVVCDEVFTDAKKFEALAEGLAKTIAEKQGKVTDYYIGQTQQMAEKVEPIKQFLAISVPETYVTVCHDEIIAHLEQLGKLNFPRHIEELTNLKTQLESRLKQQKGLFEQALVKILTDQKLAFQTENQSKIDQLQQYLKEIPQANRETLASYQKFVDDERNKLATIKSSDEVINYWLAEQKATLKNVAHLMAKPSIQKIKAEIQTEKESFSKLLEQVSQAIENRETILKMDDENAISERDIQIEKSRVQIETYKKRFEEVKQRIGELKKEQELEYTNEKAKLNAVDENILKAVKQVNEIAISLGLLEITKEDTADLTALAQAVEQKKIELQPLAQTRQEDDKALFKQSILLGLNKKIKEANTKEEFARINGDIKKRTASYRKILTAPIYNGLINVTGSLAKTDNQDVIKSTKQSIVDLITGEIKALQSKFEARQQNRAQLNQLLEKLTQDIKGEQETARSSLTQLVIRQRADISSWFEKFTDAKNVSDEESYHKHLASLNTELNLLEVENQLAKTKRDLIQTSKTVDVLKEKLGNIQKNLSESAEHKQPFQANWQANYQNCRQELAQVEITLNTFQQELSTAQQKFTQQKETHASIAERLQQKTGHKQATLSEINQKITHECVSLTQAYTEIEQGHQNIILALNNKKAALLLEEQQVAALHEHLTAAGRFIGTTNFYLLQFKPNRYAGEIIERLVNGELANPGYIVEEDKFYREMQQKIAKLRFALNKVQKPIIANLSPALTEQFDQAWIDKMARANAALNKLETEYNQRITAWQEFSEAYALIKNSRTVSQAQMEGEGYRGYDLRGIHLSDKDFQNILIQDTNFSHAVLTNCTFRGSLEGVNFRDANVSNCNFDRANFKGVNLNTGTHINWQQYGYSILHDNLAIPPFNVNQEAYLTDLITLVNQRCSISADWVLVLLKEIGSIALSDSNDEEALRQAQQRAVFFMQQIVPYLSIDAVLGLHDLIDKKHADDNNPYGFIRRELDWGHGRFKYGNTKAWENVVMPIKNRLLELANTPGELAKLNETQEKQALKIMETHTVHDYGFGFFYTPSIAKEWEAVVAQFKQNGQGLSVP